MTHRRRQIGPTAAEQLYSALLPPTRKTESYQNDQTMVRPTARGLSSVAVPLLLAQIREELSDGKAEGDQRQRRSDPGDLRSLISEQRTLTGETHARIRIIYGDVIGVFVSDGLIS